MMIKKKSEKKPGVKSLGITVKAAALQKKQSLGKKAQQSSGKAENPGPEGDIKEPKVEVQPNKDAPEVQKEENMGGASHKEEIPMAGAPSSPNAHPLPKPAMGEGSETASIPVKTGQASIPTKPVTTMQPNKGQDGADVSMSHAVESESIPANPVTTAHPNVHSPEEQAIPAMGSPDSVSVSEKAPVVQPNSAHGSPAKKDMGGEHLDKESIPGAGAPAHYEHPNPKSVLIANKSVNPLFPISDRLVAFQEKLQGRKAESKVGGQWQTNRDHAERRAYAWDAGYQAAKSGKELGSSKVAYQAIDMGSMKEFQEGFDARVAEQHVEEAAPKEAKGEGNDTPGTRAPDAEGERPVAAAPIEGTGMPDLHSVASAEEKAPEAPKVEAAAPVAPLAEPEKEADMSEFLNQQFTKSSESAEWNADDEGKFFKYFTDELTGVIKPDDDKYKWKLLLNEDKVEKGKAKSLAEAKAECEAAANPMTVVNAARRAAYEHINASAKEGWGWKGAPAKTPEDKALVDMGKGPHVPLEPGDYKKLFAHLKEAVDEKAKEYYDKYFGGYGEQLTKDIALKAPSKMSSKTAQAGNTDALEKAIEELDTMVTGLAMTGWQDCAMRVEAARQYCEDELSDHKNGSQKIAAAAGLAWKKADKDMKEAKTHAYFEVEAMAEAGFGQEHGVAGPSDIYLVGKANPTSYKWSLVSGQGSLLDSGEGFDSLDRAKAEAERSQERKSVGAEMSMKTALHKTAQDSSAVKALMAKAEGLIAEEKFDEAQKVLDDLKALMASMPKSSHKIATNEGGVPPEGGAIFGDSVIAQDKKWPPATHGTVMWVEDAALHGDRNEVTIEWDKSLNDCCSDLQLKHHIKTFVQQLGTIMEKNWGIVADIQVIQFDRDTCHAVATFRSSYGSPFVPEMRTTELRQGESKDSRPANESHDYKTHRG